MKKMRLFPKTFLYTMCLMCIIMVVSHALLYFLLPSVYVQQKNNNTSALANQLEKEMSGKSLDEVLQLATTYNEENDASISIKAGNQVFSYFSSSIIDNNQSQYVTRSEMLSFESTIDTSSNDLQEAPVPIEDISSYTIRIPSVSDQSFTPLTQGSIITLEKTISLQDQSSANIIVSMNLQPVNEATEVMFQILPYTIGISILISLCAAFFYARAITKPIKTICASTKQMESLDQGCTCLITTQDEIGELAESINQLYSTLQSTISSLENEITHVSQVEQMKVDFLRSASHELKTPLTSLSVILENMILGIGKYKDHPVYLKKCHALVTHLSDMVKEILDTSSLEGIQQQTSIVSIDVAEWIQKESEPYASLARAKGIHMKYEFQESFTINQNTFLLHKVISNVLANAVQYSEEDSCIYIRLHDHQLIIENECTPIEEMHLPHLKEAFYRPDFSRTKQTGGNGLGLYISDQILTMLELPYQFLPYAQGMRFTIDLSEA